MTLDTLTSQLDPAVAPYVALALVVWWLTRRAYKDGTQDRSALLDRYEARFAQLETSLSNVSQELAAKTTELESAKAALAELREKRDDCDRRMRQLEAKYEKRIKELKAEIAELRDQQAA